MFIESLKSENCEDLIYLSGAHSVTHGGIQNCECDSGGEIDIGLQEWNNFSVKCERFMVKNKKGQKIILTLFL